MTYQFEKASVLVIDDMRPMLALTTSLLKIFGFKTIHSASNPEDGLNLAFRENPDLIITDWLMEPFDGIEFSRRLRKSDLSPNPYVPIILMTGYGAKIRVEQARDAGITEFLVKPFTAKDLYSRIEQLIEKPRKFVDSQNFFGPDRRRRRNNEFNGPFRRGVDFESDSVKSSNDKRIENILKKLRQEAGGNNEA